MLDERVLFIDGEAIVLDKPAGLPVTPPQNGGMSLENHRQSLAFGFHRWPNAVHRLDRDTSGCLLMSRNPKAMKRFQRAFEERRVGKRYVAVLDGVPAGAEGTIDLPLAKISSEEAGWRMVGAPDGKPAVTHWRLLKVIDDRALVAFRPETGRTHQIRVHALEGLGIAVVGDPVYGNGTLGKNGIMLLHSEWIHVTRDNKPPVEARAPLPHTFITAGFADDDIPPP
ncbi:MAG: RNA pseudouridine synthase [Sphingomonadales bacterium]|nr:RNA pseudouridine synthase [Sphingomonadales bacterium]